MIEITGTEVFGVAHSMKIMRLPLESGDKSDTVGDKIGPNDFELSRKLFKAGPDHAKHLDHIFVQCVVKGPRYWLAELMTYTTMPARPVSGSTMHNLLKRPVKTEDFEIESDNLGTAYHLCYITESVNSAIRMNDLRMAKALLPESYKQERGFTFNFTNLANIYRQRKNHRLKEWQDFCKWIEDLPYSELIIDKGCELKDKKDDSHEKEVGNCEEMNESDRNQMESNGANADDFIRMIKMISEICGEDPNCDFCPFLDNELIEGCIFCDSPNKWDGSVIKKQLDNYLKEYPEIARMKK